MNETNTPSNNHRFSWSALKCFVMDHLKHRCRHEFVLADIMCTNIAPPKRPDGGAEQSKWDTYYVALYNGDHHTKRVKWPCRKCKEVFYAHCGLDISPKNGPIVLP